MSGRVRGIVVAGCLVLGTGAGAAVVGASAEEYRADSAVLVDVGEVAQTDQVAQIGNYTMQQVANYANLAKTPAVLDSVVSELELDTPAQHLAAQIETSVPMDSTTVNIQATGDSPQQARELADATAESLVREVEELAPRTESGTVLVSATQVTDAVEPSGPSSPGILVGMAAGAGLGLVVGLVLMLVIGAVVPQRRAD